MLLAHRVYALLVGWSWRKRLTPPKKVFCSTLRQVCGLLLVAGGTTLGYADMVIDGYTDAVNDRFSNSDQFILDGVDLSGVGQQEGGAWATAISRNVVISANHARPNGFINFYPGNDPTVEPVRRFLVEFAQVGSTDLFLAVMRNPLPDEIAHYPLVTERLVGTTQPFPLAVDDAGSLQNANAYLVGGSQYEYETDPDRDRHKNQAVGRNLITGYSENVDFEGYTDADSIILEYDGMNSGSHVQYESHLSGTDSGGPAFVDLGGQLHLLGINSFIYDSNDFEIGGEGSGLAYVGNQADFIHNFIALHATPEPTGFALLLVGLGITTTCRVRRNP